jgi:hypothetical protein
MKKLTIPKIESASCELSLDHNNIFWESAAKLEIDNFRVEGSAHQPNTNVKIQFSKNGLFLLFEVQDQFVIARHTKANSNVFEDSCVEFFVKPFGVDGYFNFEFNCIGTVLASYIKDNTINEEGLFTDILKFSNESFNTMKVISTFSEPITEEVQTLTIWRLATFVPFSLFHEYSNLDSLNFNKPWLCNFYKCADKSSHPHWASWNPVSELNFHNVNDFGELHFKEAIK